MLKIFFKLDEMDNIESNLLAEAANRLDVGEFQIFQMGYEAWYGGELDPQRLEAVFFDYLINNKIAPWAHHYARKIIEQDDAGELDYRDPQYHRFDAPSMSVESKRAGWLKVSAVMLIVLVFLGVSMYLLQGKTYDDFPCHFPPCYRAY